MPRRSNSRHGWLSPALALLAAGPLSMLIALFVLLLNAGQFAHGPGEPTAGREEAWTALWFALGTSAIGHAVSATTAVVLGIRWLVRRQPLALPLRIGVGYGLLAGILMIWYFLT
jgi:hypothetical protein